MAIADCAEEFGGPVSTGVAFDQGSLVHRAAIIAHECGDFGVTGPKAGSTGRKVQVRKSESLYNAPGLIKLPKRAVCQDFNGRVSSVKTDDKKHSSEDAYVSEIGKKGLLVSVCAVHPVFFLATRCILASDEALNAERFRELLVVGGGVIG